MQPLSTDSYKGVRDFYPEDQFIQNYIFEVWKSTAESFGYLEYNASPLELASLYEAKSGEEIINDQTYTFTDRGGREVTLRPEMTPTVARMIARKRGELLPPIRWYSIPNLFRYEKPQRGRLREHFQLNIDMFGASTIESDTEIILLAHSLLLNFGATDTDFVIKINSRKIINALFAHFSISDGDAHTLSKAIDKQRKISASAFETAIAEILNEKTKEFIHYLTTPQDLIALLGEKESEITHITSLIQLLDASGIKNIEFDPTLMRGFDYYTGFVFEIFDTHKDNPRALFGGGRYDKLLEIFGVEPLPAVGFGVGDVTTRDFLETHNLLPDYKNSIDIFLCRIDNTANSYTQSVAKSLRNAGLNILVDVTGRKTGDQIKYAHKQNIPYLICIGENEEKTNVLKIRNMESRVEIELKESDIAQYINEQRAL